MSNDEDDITLDDINALTAADIEGDEILAAAVRRQLKGNPELMKALLMAALNNPESKKRLLPPIRKIAKKRRGRR